MGILTQDMVTIPDDIPDLSGKLRPNDRVFFVPPPGEIGPLCRAESTLQVGKREVSAVVRSVIIGLGMLPGLGIMVFGVVNLLKLNRDNLWPIVILSGGAAAFLGGLIPWYFTRFKVSCAYVGQVGAIRYILRGKVGNNPTVKFIEFQKATELRTSQTRHYYNGVYTGTSYSFTWTDGQGRRVFMLRGQHRGKNGLPKAGDPFHFANSTEIAWSMFLLNRADAELAEKGALTFRIDAKKAVIVGPGFIEFHFGGRDDRCEAGDIKSITLNQGQFSIHHRDAKWYSSKGKFSFPYGTMANARLFLLVLDRFLPPSTWAQKT